jgi:hypothetical protein
MVPEGTLLRFLCMTGLEILFLRFLDVSMLINTNNNLCAKFWNNNYIVQKELNMTKYC